MASLIYCITNKTTGKKYIGWTNKDTPLHRWKVHLQCANRGNKSHLYNAIRLYGPEDFIIEEIERGDNDDYMLNEREPYYIAQYDDSVLYNMTSGGEGRITSTSWKKDQVPSNKGKKMPSVSEARKLYWKKWKEENPEYKSKWKVNNYKKKGYSDEERERRKFLAISRNSKQSICPHCNKEGQHTNMKRWHFDNCKHKANESYISKEEE